MKKLQVVIIVFLISLSICAYASKQAKATPSTFQLTFNTSYPGLAPGFLTFSNTGSSSDATGPLVDYSVSSGGFVSGPASPIGVAGGTITVNSGAVVSYSFVTHVASTDDGLPYTLNTVSDPDNVGGGTPVYESSTISATYFTHSWVYFYSTGLGSDATGNLVSYSITGGSYAGPISPLGVASGPIVVDEGATINYNFYNPVLSTISDEQYRLSSVGGNVSGFYNYGDSPQLITGNYVLQDDVAFTASANVLSDSSAPIVTADSFSYTVGVNTAGTTTVTSGSYAASALPYKVWVDYNTPIAYSFASSVASSTSPSTIQYIWSSTSGLDTRQTDPSLTVLSPGTVTGNYVTQALASSTTTTLLSKCTITLGGSVKDTATVTSAATGTVTFYVSTNGVTWTQLDTESLNNVDIATSNSYYPPAAGTYYFMATYSGDSNFLTSSSGALAEPLTVTMASTCTATELSACRIILGNAVTDKITISTRACGTLPSASGTWTLYVADNPDMRCETKIDCGLVTSALPFVITSSAYAPSCTGTYYFKAVYSGDNNYACSTRAQECLTVVPKAFTDTDTCLSKSSITVGGSVTDTATVSSCFGTPTGAVQFYVSNNGGCSWTVLGGAVTLNCKGTATSISYTASCVGTYYFKAVYSGDNNYACSTSDPECLTVSRGCSQ